MNDADKIARLEKILAAARTHMQHYGFCDVCDIAKHGDSGEGECDCGAGPVFELVDEYLAEIGVDPFEGHTEQILAWREEYKRSKQAKPPAEELANARRKP